MQKALEDLFICPLLHMGDRPGQLDRILVNIIGGADLGIAKVNEVMSQVSKRFNSRDDIVFGAVIDESREQSLEICILGKAELEAPKVAVAEVAETAESGAQKASSVTMEGLGLETEIAKENQPPRPVHKSKLQKKQALAADQDEFMFIEVDAQRGYFEKTDRNLYRDEDLDVPTYLRKGIKIKIKA